MILVDSSVWVDFFSSAPGQGGDELRGMIKDAEPFALTGVVVTEILQGLTRDAGRIEQYLSQWEMLEPRGFRTYREAAAIFRLGWNSKMITAISLQVSSRVRRCR